MPISSYSNSRKRNKSEAGNPRLVFFALCLAALVAGGVFLATRDIPAPRHAMERIIGNDRFFNK